MKLERVALGAAVGSSCEGMQVQMPECGNPGTRKRIGAGFWGKPARDRSCGQSQGGESTVGCMRPCSQEEYFRQGQEEGRGADPDVYAEGNRAGAGRQDHASDRACTGKTGRAKVAEAGPRHRFGPASTPRRNILLLAVVTGPTSGSGGAPATGGTCWSANTRCTGKPGRFARAGGDLVSHLYNLRATAAYRRRAGVLLAHGPRPSDRRADAQNPIPAGENPATCGWTSRSPGDSGTEFKGVFPYQRSGTEGEPQWKWWGCAEGKSGERFSVPGAEADAASVPVSGILGFSFGQPVSGVRQLHGWPGC